MRAIKQIHGDKPPHWVGDGFLVQTLINHLDNDPDFNYQHTDPFLLLDFGTPTQFAPNPNFDSKPHGIGKHPHKGFETVTVAYQGAVSHKDSGGGSGTIDSGDVQWMTAGRGIVHEEFHAPEFGKKGGTFSMAQLWVNLPSAHKNVEPKYQGIKRDDIPNIALADSLENKAGSLALIAGNFQGQTGAAATFTPINIWDISLLAAKQVNLEIPNRHTLLLLIQEGRVMVNDKIVEAGQLVEFTPAITANASDAPNAEACDEISLQALDTNARLLLLSGQPIGEPIAAHGPFVMTTPAELKQAFEDYRRGQFG